MRDVCALLTQAAVEEIVGEKLKGGTGYTGLPDVGCQYNTVDLRGGVVITVSPYADVAKIWADQKASGRIAATTRCDESFMVSFQGPQIWCKAGSTYVQVSFMAVGLGARFEAAAAKLADAVVAKL